MTYQVHWLLKELGGRDIVACGRLKVHHRTRSISHVTCKYCLRHFTPEKKELPCS